MNQQSKIDGYDQFFKIINSEIFFEFGINNIISIDSKAAATSWDSLKERIANKDRDLYVRNSGRNGTGNSGLSALYKDVFQLEINFDLTNNTKPTQILTALTGHRKNKTIFNYQVSHVFGNTKNVYLFTAPWNIVFIPKVVDPFTGHEATGAHAIEFQYKFKAKIYTKYRDQIEDYNTIINRKRAEIKSWISENLDEDVGNKYLKDFAIIPEPKRP